MARVDSFLKLCVVQGSSDLHLAVGTPPLLRYNGEISPIKFRDLGDAELDGYINEMLSESQRARFAAGEDLDFSYFAQDVGRFRVNVYRTVNGPQAALRYVPNDIPSIAQLALPPIVETFSGYKQGLVLVTGPTGSGKSTTLAALLDKINQNKNLNIVTLEDPIEFVHPSRKSQVIQREIGTHVPSFADGLRSALREDPDVILVGEMRDPVTISMAMLAAETGHLVFGTLHTTTAVKSIDRIIDALPGTQRSQAKTFIAQNLHAVATQLLIRRADGHGRVPVCEVMLMTHAIANLILQDKTFQIPNQIQTSRDKGMQLMDHSLLDAVERKLVDPNEAFLYALDRRPFERFLTDPNLARGTVSGTIGSPSRPRV